MIQEAAQCLCSTSSSALQSSGPQGPGLGSQHLPHTTSIICKQKLKFQEALPTPPRRSFLSFALQGSREFPGITALNFSIFHVLGDGSLGIHSGSEIC